MAFAPWLGELIPLTSDFKPLDCFARVLQAAPMLAMTYPMHNYFINA
jgi:hypothetical protein